MAVLKPNDYIVHEFVIPLTIALKKWAAENSLQLYGPIEHRRVPGNAKHKDEAFVIFGAVEHIISHEIVEFGASFGVRFNKPIPETMDELNQTMEDITDPLVDYFWPGRRKAEVVN